MNEKTIKEFNLPRWRNYLAGSLLTLMGLSPVIMSAFIDNSLSEALKMFLGWFIQFPGIIIALMYSAILFGGISYFYKALNNTRLKITTNGIYYRKMSRTRYEPFFTNFDLNSDWIFIPFSQISDIRIDGYWSGYCLELFFKDGTSSVLSDINALSKKDKFEIMKIVKYKIIQ